MGNIKTLQVSFGGGEISPEMFGRIDDAKFRSGAAMLRNFMVKPHGPAENRPGFAYVRSTKHSGSKRARLISFTYSTTQTMIIELGEGYFRFHTGGATLLHGSASAWATATAYVIGDLRTNGGVVYYCKEAHSSGTFATDLAAGKWHAQPASGEYEVPNPYSEADLFDIHHVQSADVLTIVHPNYQPMELSRRSATRWILMGSILEPGIAPPAAGSITPTNISHRYVVTARIKEIESDWDGETTVFVTRYYESLASTSASCSNDLTLTGFNNKLSWTPRAGAVSYYVYKYNGSAYLFLGTASGTTFVDDKSKVASSSRTPPASSGYSAPTGLTATAITSTSLQLPTVTATTAGGTTNQVACEYVVSSATEDGLESIASQSCSVNNNLFLTGNFNTISWPSVPGASHYKVYKKYGGMYGYIGNSRSLSFVDNNIEADLSVTPKIAESPFSSPGNYPAAVSYYEQRKCFAGTINKPQNIWATRSGTEGDMSYSLPIRDDDRISFRIAAREANTIRHIVPLNHLVILTSSAEWRVTSVNSDAITPTTISVRPQSYIGASNVQPVVINNTMIYGAARGGHVREMAYNWQSSGFVSGDLSLRASHLFDNKDITDMACAKAPYPVVWFVSSSGRLLGLTYVPEQQIGAWHWHDTDGEFESCAVVAEGNEDVLYVVVRRSLGESSVRYIERLSSRQFGAQEDAFFVDSGLTYSGAAATTISGLDHLEGKTVSILADGAVHPQRVVTSGAVTLDVAASKVHIGLPIMSDLQTLPIAAELKGDGALAQGRMKNINKLWVRVFNSSGIFAGPSVDKLTEAKQRTNEPMGTAPALRSGEIPIMVGPSWGDSGQVYIRQANPLPLTIVGLTLEVALGS